MYFKNIIIFCIISVIASPLLSQMVTDPKEDASRGLEFGQQKRYGEAIKEFDKAISAYNESSAKVYHNKGWVLELQKDIPGAIASYEEAVKRNPKQVPSLERLGYLYFKDGRYEEAVSMGERVISLDPNNEDVIKWLPEAYTMRLKKQREDILAKQEEDKKKLEQERNLAGEKKEEDKGPPQRYIYATFDFMIRTGNYFKDGEKDKGYHYISTPGYFVNVPEMLNVNFTPTRKFEFDLEAGNPYLGALSPNLVIHTEKLEAIVHTGNYFLGAGLMGNHYKGSFAYLDGGERTRQDYKTGFIFGFEKDKADMTFTLYPRALPYDRKGSSGKTFDTDYAEIDYKYHIDKLLTFYSWFSARDYYFFDHEAETSNYWGVYDLGFGIDLGEYKDMTDFLRYVRISLQYNERFYLMDLNNDNPYAFANGQGWFGVNSDKWFKGDPFSGYRARGHVLTARVEEGITANFFIYQSLIIEIVDRKEDHDEINLLLGLGGVY